VERQFPVNLPEGYVEFFKNLESFENEKEINLKNKCSFEKYDLLPLLASNAKPLLQLKGINIEKELYKEIFLDLLSFVAELRPETVPVMNTLRENVDELNFPAIIDEFIADDSAYFAKAAEELGVSEELFIFVLDHSLRPFLRIYASTYQEALANDEFQSWNLPTICPICGSKSHFSRLRTNDGRRFMFCDRCFSEWEARYLQCIYCGNNEPGSIKYMSIENDEAYQIYTCEKCKGYLKTYDERQSGKPTDLYIANIETIYLDMLAQEKGYTNHDFGINK